MFDLLRAGEDAGLDGLVFAAFSGQVHLGTHWKPGALARDEPRGGALPSLADASGFQMFGPLRAGEDAGLDGLVFAAFGGQVLLRTHWKPDACGYDL
jgi:hypothetical protein